NTALAGTPFLIQGAATLSPTAGSQIKIERVTVDGLPVDAIDAAGSFFHSVVLAPGQNHYNMEAFDSIGRTAAVEISITGTQSTSTPDFSELADVSASLDAT